MLKRCIMIFPEFENSQIIDNIRDKYDPLANHVRPHITLVFPFESDIKTDDLRTHISSALSKIKKFELVLNKITPTNAFGRYLFLNIHTGMDKIIEIHQKLYSGILEDHFPAWLKGNNYFPHMTVGSFDNDASFEVAINETKDIHDYFKSIVKKISVEIIDENEDSIIELEIKLS
ncbi:2'-5' RNA ligase family protein [Clostridium sp. YIM B02505]|uniref:2'-5' RNA ligase family protein n=1 Tax=Clostridium yunnanense TaxID=2800325 RepID=A0ABS1EIE1_9CLOT|nr:2'-5' RNA ligase family protein [Clostridium yunnanense]MBK1809117.1 2'-5' RNA ligase family protein [Clostridium yunnanense]